MKKLIFLCIYILFTHFSFGNTTTNPISKITSVTVFPTGAMVNRDIDISLLEGEHTLEINGLPSDLFKKSIIIESHNNIEIISILSYLDNSFPEETFLQKTLNTQSVLIKDSLAYYYALNSTLNSEKNMITDHDNFENEKGNSNIDDVIKASEFYKKRIKEIELEFLDISKAIRKLNIDLSYLKLQFDSLSIKNTKMEYKVK